MPSYLVSAKEAFVPVELYKPPFEALGDMLRIKQQQYMQGFQRIKSLDNSLLNKPVLGEEANARKQEYIADISRKLKDLPNVDLSLPQNQADAEKVFEPIINDKALNYNRELTSDAYNQLSTAESFELSDDPKKRSQYHPAAKQDIYDMMEEIGDAGLDPKNYQKIAKRKFTPFFDIKQDIVDRFKSEKGMDLTYDEVQGNYIVKTTNGERSLDKYEIMGSDILNDPKYNAQLSVQARVEVNRRIRQERQVAPNITRDQARQRVIGQLSEDANDYYTNLHQGLLTQSSSLRENLKAMGPIEQDPNKPGYDPRRIEAAQAYGSQIASLDRKINSIAGKKPELIHGISINPEGFLAEKIRDGYIQSFARSRAANTSREIKANDVVFKEDESKRGWATINLNNLKEINDQSNIVNGLTGSGNSSGKVQYNADGTVKMTAQQVKEAANAPSMLAYELNTDSNALTAYGVWNNYMGKIKEKSKSALLDVNGGLITALSTLSDTITPTDIMHYSSAMSKDAANMDYRFNKEEAAAANKIAKTIKEKYGINVTGPGTLANALFTITKDYGTRVSNGEIKDDGNLLVKLEAASDEHTRTRKEYDAYNKEYEDLVIKNVQGNRRFQKILVDEDGKKRIITPEHIANDFMNLKYLDPETNTIKKISKEMALSMGTDFLNGKEPIGTGIETNWGTSFGFPVMNINGQQVKVYLNPKESHVYNVPGGKAMHEMGLDPFVTAIRNKYGNASELNGLYKSALGQVVPNMKHWQEKTGQMTPVMSLPFATDLKGETAVRLVQELSYGNNIARATITEANGEKRDLTPEERLAYMNLMKGSETEVEKAFGNPSYRPFTTGKGTVQLTLSPSLSDEYVKNNNLGDLIGKPVNFDLSPDAQGETIKRIAVNEQFFTYGDLLKGKTVESNSALTPLGYSFTARPNFNDERANSVTIFYNYKIPNKDNPSKPILMKKESNPIIIKGDGAVNIDQVIAEARQNLVMQFKAVQQSIPKVSAGSNTAVDPTSFIR